MFDMGIQLTVRVRQLQPAQRRVTLVSSMRGTVGRGREGRRGSSQPRKLKLKEESGRQIIADIQNRSNVGRWAGWNLSAHILQLTALFLRWSSHQNVTAIKFIIIKLCSDVHVRHADHFPFSATVRSDKIKIDSVITPFNDPELAEPARTLSASPGCCGCFDMYVTKVCSKSHTSVSALNVWCANMGSAIPDCALLFLHFVEVVFSF